MSSNFDFTIDTEAMARSIDGVNRNVVVVGTAVGAMEAAVVAAENEMSETICRSIDSGFYTLLKSRFSQRLSQFSSTMSSRTGSMVETAKAIDNTRTQMQNDFNRIKSRYVKVFSALDRSLEERVRDLDCDAIELARMQKAVLTKRQVSEVPRVLMYSSDTQSVVLRAGNARLKSRVYESIDDLGSGAHHIVEYESVIQDVSLPTYGQQEPETTYMPVVYALQESFSAPNQFFLNPTVPTAITEGAKQSIVMGVRRKGNALTASSPRQMTLIRSYFVEEVGRAGVDERVRQTMMNLFDRSFSQVDRPETQAPASQQSAPQGDAS